MKLTKTLSLLALGVVATSLFGCQGKEDPAATQTPPVSADAKPDPKTDKKSPGANGAPQANAPVSEQIK